MHVDSGPVNHPRPATYDQIRAILRDHRDKFEEALGPLGNYQLCVPTDGNGLRVRVAFRPDVESRAPESIRVFFEGETVEIPLEVSEDYQDFRPL